jgi:hypothetical protein
MRMRHTVMAFTTLQYFSTVSYKWHDFRKKKNSIEQKNVFFDFFTNCLEIFFILRITQRVMIKTVYLSSCKVPVILVIF